MNKSVINFIFFSLLPATSFAGQIANVKYTHDYITQATGITVTKNAGASDTSPVNMSYLLTAIDAANNPTRSTYSLSTTYRSGGSATTNAVDTDTVINGIATLYNCKGPGGYKSGTKCLICPKDYYCPSGSELSISCSTVGTGYITDSTGSSLSSQCHASVPPFSVLVNSGTESSFTVPVITGGTSYNYVVYWGDGTSNSYTTGGNKTHTYPAANTDYTINISGTLYDNAAGSSTKNAALIRFDGYTTNNNIKKTKQILSDYMNLFPGSDTSALSITGAKDYFMYQMFYANSNFLSISDDFLSGFTGTPGSYFLYSTFYQSGLSAIPTNFLSGITGAQKDYFLYYTFYACANITSIPSNFLSGVTGSQGNYFLVETFENTNITTIPSNFLSGLTGAQGTRFMNGTFIGTKLTSTPDNFLPFVTGTQSADFMMATFGWSITTLTKVSLGSHAITPPTGSSAFSYTFSGAGNSTTPMQVWLWWKDSALSGMSSNSMALTNNNVSQIHVPANLVTTYRNSTIWSNITDAKFTPILCSDITTTQISKFGAVPSNYCCTDNATTCTLYNGSNYTW